MKNKHLFFSLLMVLASLLNACHKPLFISSHTNHFYTISNQYAADSAMVQMLRPYKIGVDTQMQVVIGYSDVPLTKAQPESTLGNFMADAQLKKAQSIDRKVVGSVVNYGGVRLPYVAPGALTRGKMYELMPFDNVLTIVEMPGSDLRQFCDFMAIRKGWPISGITYLIKDKAAADIRVDGLPLNDNVVYKIAMGDYIANGGDNADFIRPLKRKNTGVFIRDAMIEYVEQLQAKNIHLHLNIEKRVQYAE
ncbi:MAG: 5'-nucleotidase C-terminal domain-containing protein [Bacteroidetes bacterium]|nr:5'-nucleotidase C-terminal domain-containing protein [Bacteroidota bacterium]